MNSKLSYLAVTFAFFIALGLALEPRAYGYIDPGSNLMLFQNLSALVAGGLFYFRRRLKSVFTRRGQAQDSTSEDSR